MRETKKAINTREVFARHHGIWEGTYTRIDVKTGQIIEKHKSRLNCNLLGDDWKQRNIYTWEDGRTETIFFPGHFDQDGWLRFDTPRLRGNSCAADQNSIFLEWIYKEEPGNHFSELITLISENHRARVWQHFEHGEFAKLTIIDEYRVSGDPQF
jgi:hypothetical protein